MARVMLISLGTGPSVEHGIAYSITTHRPDRVIFFATAESEKTLTNIESLPAERPPMETIRISNGDDPNEIYRVACGKLQELRHDEVFVDFTSGTKAMSAGLVAAAIAEGIQQLVYVSGRRGADGRVISGTEQVITLKPADILVDQLKRQVVQFFNKRLFSAVLQLVEQGLSEIHLPEHRRDLEELRVLCFAYQAWDWFDHARAADQFRQINRESYARWSDQIAANRAWVCELAPKLKLEVPIEKRYCQELLIDLWLNAQRRIEEGRWVDATARLYRLTELIAQYSLSRHGLDTGRLETNELPQGLQSKYEMLRDEKRRVKLGLEQAYELLTELDDPVGQRYDQRLQDALRARNESISGHGLRPVTEENCRKLSQTVKHLLDQAVPTWNDQVKQAQFAQLH